MKNIALLFIIILAATLRLYNLDQVPPSASLDEASIGWNAYSVLKTGADEFGDFPLISQRGYDDFRRSTYLLLVVPFIALFDLQTLSIRLPSVLLSLLTVATVYNIVLVLFKNRTHLSETVALVSALFLAISPWHVYISRIGHESNACLSFLVFGLFFFLKGLRQNTYMLPAVLFLLLSMVSYYTGQIVVPLVVGSIGLVYSKQIFLIIFRNKTSISISFFLAAVTIWILFSLFSPQAMIRYRGTSALSPEVHPNAFAAWIDKRNQAVASGNIVGRLLYNPRLFIIKIFTEGYLSHFQPSWLFYNTGQESFKAPNTGLLYIWQIPFICLGILIVIFSKQFTLQSKLFVLFLFFITALPGAVATQAPHAMRAYNIVPLWQIFTGIGLTYLLFALKQHSRIFLIIVSVFITIQFQQFIVNYFFRFPFEQSKSFQYALAKSVPEILKQRHYTRVVISNTNNLYQSYMLFLYHSMYDPHLYQSFGGTVSGGYAETHRFDRYEFRPIIWEKEDTRDTLFVGNPEDFPPQATITSRYQYINGDIGVVMVSEN